MSDPRQQRLKSLFVSVLELGSAEERQAYLDAQCADDVGLRAELMGLLGLEQEMGGFLEDQVVALELPSTKLDSQIGPYKVREQLGVGGMGIVYVAEQIEPVRRQVALKIIKPGMDSQQVVSRFETERQVLALMNHPNIAKVFDAGSTPEGRPYFAMELVRGIPITEFCDEQRLSIRERLKLFATVCHAVQHAHLKGIIHRDLKPSNVLVELHDVTPVPKVIDFGVAKAIRQKLSEKTVYTQFLQMIGTPLYMSPEQTQLNGLDVDTRSDVYSLGVMLYELITGTTPFDRETTKSVDYDELRRMIREDDPPRPSQRISTLDAKALSTLSERRGSDSRRLDLGRSGELDWIVLKALEKDRTRRYESASELASDVERFLSNQPVKAMPPSLGYRLKKTIQRHGVASSFGVVLLLILIVSGTAIAWKWTGERIATREAAHQSDRAEANLELALGAVDKMYKQLARSHEFQLHAESSWQRTLLTDALQFYQAFVDTNHDSEPSVAIVRTHMHLGEIQGLLGRHEQSDKSYRKALELAEQFQEPPSRQTEIQFITAQSLFNLAKSATEKDWPGAQLQERRLTYLDRSREILNQLVADHPDNLEYLISLSDVEVWLGRTWGEMAVATATGHGSDESRLKAKRHFDAGMALLRDRAADPTLKYHLANHYNMLAQFCQETHQMAEAELAYRQGLAVLRQITTEDPNWAQATDCVGSMTFSLGMLIAKDPTRADEAKRLFATAVDFRRALVDQAAPDDKGPLMIYSFLFGQYVQALRKGGELDECLRVTRDAIDHEERRLRNLSIRNADDGDRRLLSNLYLDLGETYEALQQYTEAAAAHQRACELHVIPSQEVTFAWKLCYRWPKSYRDSMRAYALIKKTLDVDSAQYDWSFAQSILALAAYRIGKYQESVDVIEQEKDGGQRNPCDWIVLAMSHAELGHEETAKQWYDKIEGDVAEGAELGVLEELWGEAKQQLERKEQLREAAPE